MRIALGISLGGRFHLFDFKNVFVKRITFKHIKLLPHLFPDIIDTVDTLASTLHFTLCTNKSCQPPLICTHCIVL